MLGQWHPWLHPVGQRVILQPVVEGRHFAQVCPVSNEKLSSAQGGSCQVKFAVVNFAVRNFAEPPWILSGTPCESPQCVPLVCEKFVENPEFRGGNFAVNLKHEISHAKLKCATNPPPPLCSTLGSSSRLCNGNPPCGGDRGAPGHPQDVPMILQHRHRTQRLTPQGRYNNTGTGTAPSPSIAHALGVAKHNHRSNE